jgi:hypothetical protein
MLTFTETTHASPNQSQPSDQSLSRAWRWAALTDHKTKARHKNVLVAKILKQAPQTGQQLMCLKALDAMGETEDEADGDQRSQERRNRFKTEVEGKFEGTHESLAWLQECHAA